MQKRNIKLAKKTKKTKKSNVMTNREFADKDQNFKDACENARCEPTSRQAAKFRNKKGTAYMYMNNLLP